MSRTERLNTILMMFSLIFTLLFSNFVVEAQDKISDDSSTGKWLIETSQIISGSKLIQSQNFTYDSCGNLVKFEQFRENQRIIGETKNTYDANNYCVRTSSSGTLSTSQGTIMDANTTNYSYDNNGNLIKQETVNNRGANYIEEYNKQGKILKRKNIVPNFGIVSTLYEYDSCGNSVKTTITSPDSSSVQEWTYEYGQNCLPLKTTRTETDAMRAEVDDIYNDIPHTEHIEYTYTKTGKVLKSVITTPPVNAMSSEIKIIIENEYDEHDNLIKSTKTRNFNFDDSIKSTKEDLGVTINTYIWIHSP